MPDANGAVADPPTIRMAQYSKHKAVVRYRATDPKAPISDVYVGLALGDGTVEGMPKQILVTVQPA